MAIELHGEIETVPGSSDIVDGWRGSIDFGEVWADADAALWREEWGELPVGRPLIYGCEARHEPTAGPRRVVLGLFAVDERRPVMAAGAPFKLRDGATERAVGRLL